MEHVKGLWIISGSGLCVFHRSYSTNGREIDQALFAGFLTAIKAMAQEATQSEIQRIQTKQSIFHFQYLPELDYYIVVSATVCVDDRVINDFINELKDFFNINIYSRINNDHVPKIEKFDVFYPEIDKITRKYFPIMENTTSTDLTEEKSQNSSVFGKLKNSLTKLRK